MRPVIFLLLLVIAGLAATDSTSQTSQSRVQSKAPRSAPLTGPGEAETIDWLNSNIKTQLHVMCFSGTSHLSTRTVTKFTIDNGHLVIQERVSEHAYFGTAENTSHENRITKLDRGKATNVVQVQQVRSSSSCDGETTPNMTFRITCQSPGCIVDGPSGTEVVIKTDGASDSQANSIVKALEHLLQVGGAKRPLF